MNIPAIIVTWFDLVQISGFFLAVGLAYYLGRRHGGRNKEQELHQASINDQVVQLSSRIKITDG